ncbi:MAG: hypothetical protein U0903_17890 [Planctomycetales bacterium]
MANWKGSPTVETSISVLTWKANWCNPEGLVVEKLPDGSLNTGAAGRDMVYFDDQTRERFIPHVIEPAGADRATLIPV